MQYISAFILTKLEENENSSVDYAEVFNILFSQKVNISEVYNNLLRKFVNFNQ